MYGKALKQYASSAGVSFYDSTLPLQALGDEKAYSIKGVHLSPLGYKVVADGIKNIVGLE